MRSGVLKEQVFMQSGRLGIRLVRHGLGLLVPVLITGLLHHPASAQTEVRTGVSLGIVDEPYTIRGNTAQALLTQMRTLGPGLRLTRFRYVSRWNYERDELESVLGVGSGRCRIRNFEVRFDVTEIYPVWHRPPNASPDLVEAWEGLEGLIDRRRREYRDGLVEYGMEMRRQTRSVEDACTFLRNRVRTVVDRVRAERLEDQRAARASGQGVRLRWPPRGFSDRSRPRL
jgi:predicted secreted Zn-dependent protease